jgi:hypothetical protein
MGFRTDYLNALEQFSLETTNEGRRGKEQVKARQ